MSWVNAVFLFFLILPVAGHVEAQQRGQWVNQELLTKQIPPAQYEAIGRGALGQCRAEAMIMVERTLSTTISCTSFTETLGAGSVTAIQQCQQAQEDRRQQREQLFQDIGAGCIAKQGWLFIQQ